MERSIWNIAALLPLVAVLACDTDDDDSADDDTSEGPMEELYAFAVIADPHISGNSDHEDRLAAAVDWVNGETEGRGIAFSLVLGDIGWNSTLETSKELLDVLDAPYVPLIGDNEIHGGDEEAFDSTFEPQMEYLATVLENWQRALVPVHNPEIDGDSWFQNFSFDHQGVHFACVDWNPRGYEGIEGETGHLYDWDGGSWPWLVQDLEDWGGGPVDSLIVSTHIPMQLLMFDLDELAAFEGLFGSYGDAPYANLAGHVHTNCLDPIGDGLYDVYCTDATWDDEITVRVITVFGNGVRFEYLHELVVVP